MKGLYKIKDVQLHKCTPKQFFNLNLTPKISHSGPQKSIMTPNLSQNQILELKKSIENKSCSTTRVDSKKVFQPFPDPTIAHWGPKKSKMTPKLDRNQKSQLKEYRKLKLFNYMSRPKNSPMS